MPSDLSIEPDESDFAEVEDFGEEVLTSSETISSTSYFLEEFFLNDLFLPKKKEKGNKQKLMES